jgi:cyclophilin family peptidyl-prolyl cis-trans isomerase/HEAT repeat protein
MIFVSAFRLAAGCLMLLAVVPASGQQASLRERMLLAEDSRAQTDAELAPLREGLNSRDPKLRRQAARAIGRLERAELIPLLTKALADSDVDVRMEAANAMGQLARGAKGVQDAKGRLVVRSRLEAEPRVWAVIAATLGRLPYTTAADVQQAESILARVLPTAATTSIQIDALLGAVEGLEALARQSAKLARLKATTLDGLRAASELEGRAQDAQKLARIRRLASLALMASAAISRPRLEAGIHDPDEEVRRIIMLAARAPIEGREAAIDKGLADLSPRVRYEALQTFGRQLQKGSCKPVLAAVRDPNPHVALLAIDLLGNGCPPDESPVSTLKSLADVLTSPPGTWHTSAHAFVALAKTDASEARKLFTRYASHSTWQVRMYTARAAGVLEAIEDLVLLGRDAHDNVREAALSELVRLKRPEALTVAVESLTRRDYQLLLTAARALDIGDSSPASLESARASLELQVTQALLEALDRVTAERRETSRDIRLALLETLQKGGVPAPQGTHVDARARLRRYLTDFDPSVAAKAAAILQAWHDSTAEPSPHMLPRIAVNQTAVDALRQARLRFTMIGRGTFELRLLIDEAPVTALRVATRAREGYYNGLTFHRVVPNFVIQGGSPGANEYVGLVSHQRGTVGISTRGRDTGDAQIFVNLVDSPRLDHIYTVFAEVSTGMDVVDALLEGDVIERVELVLPPT